MLLLIERRYEPEYTPGTMFVNDLYFADTLEDPRRDTKVYGDTCIPEGTYEVTVDYSPAFGKDMIHIMNVPGFDGIRIHWGHTKQNTKGCPLVGKRPDDNDQELLNDGSSTRLFALINERVRAGEYCAIIIRERKKS